MTIQIVDAIMKQEVLEIIYFPGERQIEPHTLGYGSDGQVLLRAYQVSGASASGESTGWKMFRFDRLENPPTNLGSFEGPRNGYRRGDSAMVGGIIAEL